MEAIRRDLRYACRSLMGQPGWTIAAILCLAIGTGPNTAAFTIVNGLLLRPLPFPGARQLVMVAFREPETARTRPFALAEFRELAPMADGVAELSIRTYLPLALASDDGSRMAQAELVSANYFDVLRVTPIAGRAFLRDTDPAGRAAEAVISHALWQRRFRGNPSVIGTVVRVNGHPVTICGIAPPRFVGVTSLIAADVWLPAGLQRVLSPGAGADTEPQYGGLGRLKPGASREQLQAALDVVIAARPRTATRPPAAVVIEASGFGVPPAVRGVAIGASALLFGLIALVTAVAIANVASLTLARATDRRREMGVRLALGATRTHIVRQMLAESVLLALAGGALGFVLAHWVVRGLAALAPATGQPAHISFALDVSQDARVFVYAVLAALAIAGLFGLAPARFASRTDVVDALKASGGSGRRPATLRALTTVVVGQIAVSAALLVVAGLLVRTYLNTLAVEPGIDTRNLLAVSLDVEQIDADPRAGRALYEDILRRVSALPDVERASLSRDRPLAFGGRDAPVWVDDGSGAAAGAPRDAGTLVVTPEYFQSLGITILQGRVFGATDGERSRVAVVNETMARRFWPDGSALGRHFRAGARTSEPIQVIGVAKDVKYRSLTEPARAVFHQPFAQAYAPQMTLLVRWRPGGRDIAAQIEREIHAASPGLAIVHAATVSDQVTASIAPRRQSAMFLLAVCALALLLTSVGLYGAMAYGVRRRAREFGIRMALGARARDVLLMVVGQGLRLALAGLAVGIAGSLALTRAIAGRLYGVSPYDPATIAVASGVLVTVALAAVYLPALWATRVEAAVSLRED